MSESAVPAAGSTLRPLARPNGWWGMVVFVATEATLFGTLVGTYFYLRFRAASSSPTRACRRGMDPAPTARPESG